MSSKVTKTIKTSHGKVAGAPAPTVTSTVTETIKSKGRKRPRKSKKLASSFGGPATTAFVKSLMDPFCYAPPSVGFGSLQPLENATGFTRSFQTIVTPTNPYFLIVASPQLQVGTGSSPGNYSLFNATGPGAVYTFTSSLSAANFNNISSRFASARFITGGIRLRCSNPAINAPPLLSAGLVYDTFAHLVTGLTPVIAEEIAGLLPMTNPNNAIEVLYRPMDTSDFDLGLQSINGYPNSTFLPHMVIAGFWPSAGAGGAAIVETVSHMEGDPGVNGNDSTVSYSPNVATECASVESLFAKITQFLGPPVRDLLVTNPISLIDGLANSTAMRGALSRVSDMRLSVARTTSMMKTAILSAAGQSSTSSSSSYSKSNVDNEENSSWTNLGSVGAGLAAATVIGAAQVANNAYQGVRAFRGP